MPNRVITTQAALTDLVARLVPSPYLAVDTEFVRERTYFAQLCLIQISTDDVVAAVDPLAPGLDMTPLYQLLVDPSRVKVFHAARQDLEIFYQLCGQVLQPVFDTQIGAMAMGLGEQIGYANLVQVMLGLTLNKSQQLTNWERRPLTEAQVSYALDDVIHLRPIYHAMRERLAANNRLHWINEEERRLTDPATFESNPDDLWRGIRTRDKSPRTMTALRELALWRDQTARRLNRPRGHILKDEALAVLARGRPATADEFNNLRGLTGDVLNRFGNDILPMMARVNSLPKTELFYPSRPGDDVEVDTNLMALASLYLKMKAQDINVTPRLLASTEELESYLAGVPEAPLRHGWRAELVGDGLTALLDGKMGLAVKNGVLSLVPLP